MPVTHSFTCPIADDPAAAAANQVLPSHWNAAHTISVNMSEINATGTPSINTFLRGDGIWSDDLGSTTSAVACVISSNQNTIMELRANNSSCSINLNQLSGTTYQFYSSNGNFGVWNNTLAFTPLALSGTTSTCILKVVSGGAIGFGSNVSNATAGSDAAMYRISSSVIGFGNPAISSKTSAEIQHGHSKCMQEGNGFFIKEGTNGRMGQATLVAGTVTVANTQVNANSRIFLSVATAGGTQGFLSYTQINGTSFTINSTSATETSIINWEIKEAV